MHPLAQSIASDRQLAGLTQGQLATSLGVSQQSVSNWEDGKALPRTKRMNQLCALFGHQSQTSVVWSRMKGHALPTAHAPSPTPPSAQTKLPSKSDLDFNWGALNGAVDSIASAAQALSKSAEILAHSAASIAEVIKHAQMLSYYKSLLQDAQPAQSIEGFDEINKMVKEHLEKIANLKLIAEGDVTSPFEILSHKKQKPKESYR